MTTIAIKLRNVYGRWLAYPANDHAVAAASLVQHLTLTRRDMTYLRALGHTIRVENMLETAASDALATMIEE